MPIPLTKIKSSKDDIKKFLEVSLAKLALEKNANDFKVYHWLDSSGLHLKLLKDIDDKEYDHDVFYLNKRNTLAKPKEFNLFGSFKLSSNHVEIIDHLFEKIETLAPSMEFKSTVFKVLLDTDFMISDRKQSLNFMQEIVKENPKISWKYIKTSTFSNDFSNWFWDVYESSDGFRLKPPVNYSSLSEYGTDSVKVGRKERAKNGAYSFYATSEFKPLVAQYVHSMLKAKAFSFRKTDLDEINKICVDCGKELGKKTVEDLFASILTGEQEKDIKILQSVKNYVGDNLTNKALKSLNETSEVDDEKAFLPASQVKEFVAAINEGFFRNNLKLAFKNKDGEPQETPLNDSNKNGVYRYVFNTLKGSSLNKLSGVEDFEIINMRDKTLCVMSVNEDFTEDRFHKILKDSLVFLTERCWANPGQDVEPFSGLMKTPEEREMLKAWSKKMLMDYNMEAHMQEEVEPIKNGEIFKL